MKNVMHELESSECLDEVEKHFEFPFAPHDFQVKALEEIAIRDCALLRFKVGLGKTFTSVLAALYYSIHEGVEQILILCPPVLMNQWYEFLTSIKGIPEVCLYRGTPKERSQMDLESSVIIVSYNIFRGKRDYGRFKKLGQKSKLCIVGDELSLKSLKSQTYRKVKEIVYRKLRLKSGDEPHHKLIALNATPISDLEQVYNWCSVFAPGVYASKRLFEQVHVVSQDHWGNVEEWRNEDMMHDNMSLFTIDTDKEIKLPPLIESVVPYQLSKKHMKLYREVEKAEFDKLPDDKVALALNSMFSTLQRLVLLPKSFGLDEESPVLEFVHGYLDQLQPDEGVLIYTRHVMVSEVISEKIPDSVAIYGGVSKTARETAFEELKSGKSNRLVGNLDSLGVGLNLQMLNHIIYLEFPFRDDKLTQGTGRVHRQGQDKTCFANYPIAEDTLQRQIYQRLLKNGEDIDKVMRTKKQIKEFLG